MNSPLIVNYCQQKVFQQDNCYCLYDSDQVKNFTPQMFEADYWQQRNAVNGTAQGRGTTYFIQHQQQQWVLRHYYRGGLIGKLIHDSYLFTGYQKTRAAQEFALLSQLAVLGLPAPKPVAYRITRSGLTYQADIISERINHAKDLVALLSEQTLAAASWRAIGHCIQRFHQQGIYHHDLNAHNILIDDQEKIWLIDFDRGEQRKPAQQWQQQNMDRLLRSFNKECLKFSQFHWQPDNWRQLMEGYLS
ncbi:3-deoxy-D-manno-octulosonic acid kinase [Thalassotalea insulae]|uniref:3-deoxy-D-manno-octulosonic acid kinase n=1 Tax=Thalassotalea insulae TaxID=2056778 RepID=A0ABQ6GUQ3_9GAMM|nr:3-deoxy-D-manno-octulosonic acid kinase [Thalassotalea insulae]GLX78395.1 3-deoxy-D-manno-octulosonic acid kinase [Thalassotalea insulae]